MNLAYTAAAEQTIQELAGSHGISPDGVRHMLEALLQGGGTMAQFSHPDFAGSGQWMQGGMTMVSDLFNHALKARVDALCTDLSARLAQGLQVHERPVLNHTGGTYPMSGAQGVSDWWPADLRYPNSVGSQNGLRYAYFAQARRLAVESAGQVTVYDTLDHQIGGFSQAQGGSGAGLALSSQYGQVNLSSLPVVNSAMTVGMPLYAEAAPSFVAAAVPAMVPAQPLNPAPEGDVFSLIEKLADLRARGILDDAEFSAKKTELLSRI